MLVKRVITALWAIPLVILAVWFDDPLPWFTVLAALIAGLGIIEFYRITGVIKIWPLTAFGLAWTLVFIVQPHFNVQQSVSLILTSGIVLSLAMLIFVRRKEGVFSIWAWMTGGALYSGWLLSLLVALRVEGGREWVYLALFATFGSDTLAYFIGKAFGRHKLAPAISPKKTWEGAVAGLLGGAIFGVLFALDTPLQLPITFVEAALLGAVISVFGQFGDLAESLLKRNFNVKNSGTLMPGHGGILDRIDSVLFAGAAVYLYYFFIFW